MIGEKEIINAKNRELAIKFPDIERNSKDIEEGFKRPSFFIESDNENYGKIGQSYADDRLTIRIYYFPSDPKNNRMENMEIKRELVGMFRFSIKVNDEFVIPVDDITSTIADKVLIVSFDLRMVQDIVDNQDVPLMEELDFNIK